MIPLFPYWRFTIHSSLGLQEAVNRLANAVTPFQLRFSYVWDKPQTFMGTVSESEFRIERIIQYRNSFVPTIYGRFLPTETGLQVRIVMLLSPIVLMLGVALSLVALPVLASIVYRFMMIGHFDQSLKVPTLLVVFLYLMFTGGFSYEAVIARRLLNRLFEDQTEKTVKGNV